ncbi:general secretion pathway protein GspB [Geopsychrobacter electrodiphilus]|uniref:general secretion pathway protein GspB n=1 Tax=Geopsychrobacter electrodiphilus TaxID=225196 RepID=UPI000371338D|nr:general secretion pathway protein GspB [Geopsychrobacter electrodiphilus]
MSSILKALRKLEEEKAALGEGGVDIARDILKRSGTSPSRSLFWPILSAVLFFLLLGGGLFVGIMGYRVETTAKLPTEKRIVITNMTPTPEPKREIPSTKSVESVPSTPDLSPIAPPPVERVAAQPKPALKAHAQPEATRSNGIPFLKVTAIAYRANPTERIAIINDLPVMQGTSIEGAEIISILPDKVILSWQGKQFEQQVEAE